MKIRHLANVVSMCFLTFLHTTAAANVEEATATPASKVPNAVSVPQGANADARVSIEQQIRRSLYAIVRGDTPWLAERGNYQALNPASRMQAQFSPALIRIVDDGAAPDWELCLKLRGFGYGDAVQAVSEVMPVARENRIEYRRSGISEWYVNNENGLEQGFTIETPPRPRSSTLLRVVMAVSTNLTPRLKQGGRGVMFSSADRGAVLHYENLVAFDRTGHRLPAWMEVEGGRDGHILRLTVDDSSAIYPLTIDPIVYVEAKKLLPSNVLGDSEFGGSVAIDGDTVVVGAPGDDYACYFAVGCDSGRAYIFQRHQGGSNQWGLVKRFYSSIPEAGARFGHAVAIHGDIVAVGEPYDAPCGSVSIFYRHRGGVNNWGWVRKFRAPLRDCGSWDLDSEFGHSVAVDGDTLVVGAPGLTVCCTSDFPGKGAAYVYGRNVGGTDSWGLMQTVVAGDGEIRDRFGWSVAISGDNIVIGAPSPPDVGFSLDPENLGYFNRTKPGAAYVFSRNVGGVNNWGETQKLMPFGATLQLRGCREGGFDYPRARGCRDDEGGFGYAVAIDGVTIVVGDPDWYYDPTPLRGAAYVFEGAVFFWFPVKRLRAPNFDGLNSEYFGQAVAVDNDTILVGGQAQRGRSLDERAHVFERHRGGQNNWGHRISLNASDHLIHPPPGEGDFQNFGRSVAARGDVFVVGAPLDNNQYGDDAGAAYIYERFERVLAAVDLGLTGVAIANESEITYTFEVTNAGRRTATEVMFTNPLSPQLRFLSIQPSQGACVSNPATDPTSRSHADATITCRLGDLSPGESAKITLIVNADGLGSIVNSARVSAAGHDARPSDNFASVITTIRGR